MRVAITAELHLFDGDIRWEQPIRLGLALGDHEFLRLSSYRGDLIVLDHEPLQALEMDELGQIVVRDVTDRLFPSAAFEVDELRIIRNAARMSIGLALLRTGFPAFCIWVNDDEFAWGDAAALGKADFAEGTNPVIAESFLNSDLPYSESGS